MLSTIEISKYLGYISQYKSGVRFQQNSVDYNYIALLENREPRATQSFREQKGLNVPSLTYIEFSPTPKPEGETTPRGENIFSLSTSTQPKTNIGLPPGTTPMDITTITTPGATSKLSDFFNTYKTPLLIGGAVIGFLLIKKFKK